MGTMISKWRPSWWTEDIHGTAWQRVSEAMKRDWMETTHDLGLGGHAMNQTATDTIKQALGQEHLPTLEQANPPKVIGEWSEAEIPYGYGFGARRQFGAQYPRWNDGLERILEKEWISGREQVPHHWGTVRGFVRRGYEYEEASARPTERRDNRPQVT